MFSKVKAASDGKSRFLLCVPDMDLKKAIRIFMRLANFNLISSVFVLIFGQSYDKGLFFYAGACSTAQKI